ncbi:MAG: amidohydrolase family protein [Candidatus Aquilonibacter sp.]
MIDIHTHLHPPRLFAAIRRWFAANSSWDIAAQPQEPTEVAAVLRGAGVERFVFCSYAHRPGMARDLNAWLVQTAQTLGGYGVPLATIHPDDPACLDDLRTALDSGCAGLKLHEDVQRVACDDERLDPIYDELAARNRFLLVHVGPIPWVYNKREGLARVEHVLQRHPNLSVIVAHFGVPDTLEYFELMSTQRNLYLDTTMVFAPSSPMRTNIAAADAIETNRERVLYGTDFPNIPHDYGAESRGLESLGLTASTLRAVLHDNAERLLKKAGV